jgi:hypothetical protein
MRFHDLPADIQMALSMLFPGTVLRIPKPTRPIGEIIRSEHDANVQVYGMTENESVRLLCQRHHMRAPDIRRHL